MVTCYQATSNIFGAYTVCVSLWMQRAHEWNKHDAHVMPHTFLPPPPSRSKKRITPMNELTSRAIPLWLLVVEGETSWVMCSSGATSPGSHCVALDNLNDAHVDGRFTIRSARSDCSFTNAILWRRIIHVQLFQRYNLRIRGLVRLFYRKKKKRTFKHTGAYLYLFIFPTYRASVRRYFHLQLAAEYPFVFHQHYNLSSSSLVIFIT